MTISKLEKNVPWIEDEEDRVWEDDDSYASWDFEDDADNDNDGHEDDVDIDEDSEEWGGYDQVDDDYTFEEDPDWKSARVAALDPWVRREPEGYLEKPSRQNRKRFSNKRRRR